ncbi:GNAT family N-acetyltransferase [Chitinophaga vietnamensis]|uniref:GNAT family N-acetyltransferase n=1 Tax=Chitinophaga vietnamensis TaxID=2593957 RepID=UPI0013763318|nr:GNAT family N-acetyltransferase [Chitinophaga vietnamensis]
MRHVFNTARLALQPLTSGDAPFIYELLNTEGWKTFIGDRHIHTLDDAAAYIEKILSNPDVTYVVARLAQDQEPAGIVTFIKRTYLPYHDIGFAFLPAYAGQGLAYEAAAAFLELIRADASHKEVLATTLPGNSRSIQLLEKLGLSLQEKMMLNGEELLLFRLVLTPQ